MSRRQPKKYNMILELDTGIEAHMLQAWQKITPDCISVEHIHRYYELVFNFSAIPMRHIIADYTYRTDSFYIMYRAPYILHTSETCGISPYNRYTVIFHHNALTEFGEICKLDKLARHLECLIPTTEEQMRSLEPLLQRLCRSQDPNVPKHMWLGSLASLLYEINELAESAIPHSIESPPYMQELLRYISENLGEPLSLEMLAKRFYVSRAKLTYDFRTTVHSSLHEYITAVRVHRAKLLLNEGVPIPVISAHCGYAQESSFIYMFKKHTGITPGEFKKQRESRE